MLKERTIGIEVFGRSTSYDPSDDATVRVKAGEVRKRLGLYYSSQGAQNPLRIELPSGTYVPEFRRRRRRSGRSRPEPVRGRPVDRACTRHARPADDPRRRAAVGLAVLVAGAGLVGCTPARPATVLDEFWAPVLKGASPVSCARPTCRCGTCDRDADQRRPVPRGPKISSQLTDQFVGGGDLIATSRLTAMLTRMRRPYRLKVGNDVSFADLRSGPAILVGYSYTRWKEISSQMRYFIDGLRRPVGITDNGKPTEWALPNLPRDRRTTEDYAIVSRVFHPGHPRHAGGTRRHYAVRHRCRRRPGDQSGPDGRRRCTTHRRTGRTKNLQLVLHVKVISGAPSAPTVVKPINGNRACGWMASYLV